MGGRIGAMKESKFNHLYGALNPKQKEAVDTIEGPVMVIAGPGTGKTHVLTLRIANILAQTQTLPENILALTFTSSAASNMRARLVEIVGTPAYKVEINTFHGFCNRVIEDFPEYFEHLLESVAATELEQVEMVEKAILSNELALLRPFGNQFYYVRAILSAINDLKKEGVSVEDFKEAVEAQKKNFEKIADLYNESGMYKGKMKTKYQVLERSIERNRELALVFEAYGRLLRKNKRHDFNDMLISVLRALEKDSNLAMSLQEKYQYILVDEHQDTNSAQNKLVEMIASYYAPNPNLFVVGDEKQAIFRFQGASLENFMFFKTLYPVAKLITLQENYRSNQMLLDATESLILKNVTTDAFAKASKLLSRKDYPDRRVRIASFSEDWMELKFVGESIKQKIEEGAMGGEIAVVARMNKDLTEVAGVFSQLGIRYCIAADQDGLKDKYVEQLLTIFRAIGAFDFEPGRSGDFYLAQMLHFEIFGINPLDVYKILKLRASKRKSLIEVLTDSKLLSGAGLENKGKVLELKAKLLQWVGLVGNDNLEELFVRVFNESGLRERVMGLPNSMEIVNKFKKVFEDIKVQGGRGRQMSLKQYLEYLDLLISHNLGMSVESTPVGKESVRLLTGHKAKGLEFDYVYIINAFEGHWGNIRARSRIFTLPWEELSRKLALGVEIDPLEDERRLFYVAMTRARKDVLITWSKFNLEGKEQLPVQFISEIEDGFKEEVDTVKFEVGLREAEESLFDMPLVVTEDKKEYLNSLFWERGLSVTALSNYLECPWKYFYKDLLTLPDVATKPLVFGTGVHLVICDYIKSLGRDVLSLDQLKWRFGEFLKRKVLNEQDYKDLLGKGNQVLEAYFEGRMRSWDENREPEIRIRGVKLDDGVSINGVIDMIEPMDQEGRLFTRSSKVAVRIVDFKTGRVKTRKQMTEGEGIYNYQRQLVFYKMLVEGYKYKNYRVEEGVVDFVQPDSKGVLRREVFKINSEDVGNLKAVVLGVAKEIRDLGFWDRFCNNPECEYCKLRRQTT